MQHRLLVRSSCSSCSTSSDEAPWLSTTSVKDCLSKVGRFSIERCSLRCRKIACCSGGGALAFLQSPDRPARTADGSLQDCDADFGLCVMRSRKTRVYRSARDRGRFTRATKFDVLTCRASRTRRNRFGFIADEPSGLLADRPDKTSRCRHPNVRRMVA